MSNVRSIISKSNDPKFNLAAEEFFLRENSSDIHFFYINSPSVIIGKHQNALAEINLSFLEEKDIPLYRRMSGGGTVYHDLGNINFCFIKNGQGNDLVNFKRATQPIVSVLNEWGIAVRHGERNDLLVNYKKISGNACHVFKRRVMHHGTLLYNSELDMLTSSLKNDPTKFQDKAVKSVRSEVMNISTIYDKAGTTSSFMYDLEKAIRNASQTISLSSLTEEELNSIEALIISKYSTPEWNYCYGPTYHFKKRTVINDHVFLVQMTVEKGKISNLVLKGNFADKKPLDELMQIVTGSFHYKREIIKKISESKFPELIGITKEEIIEIFF
jgi:lipoate---protein ligase